MEQQVLHWIAQYGYVAIFSLLVLGIIGLPIPDETMLTLTGVLVQSGKLSLPLALLAAFLGSTCGITLSYVLGRTFGLTLIHRYGRYVRLREEHVEKAHAWFRRAGHWSLTFGYFIPGVRHFTAYAAGMSCLEFPQFALYAYSGAALWSCTFIGLGYFLGDRWRSVLENIHQYLIELTIAGVILALGYLVWRRKRRLAKP
jgi:membrane protein DedA with SNARE-associated domain